MRYLVALLFAALSLNAVGQTNLNYNPDYDNDGAISVNDLLGFLSIFGDIWDSADVIMGCTYPDAAAYNPLATMDDGSCTFLPDCVGDECGVCGGSGIAEGTCDCEGNVLDNCGVCGGDNACCSELMTLASTPAGCDGGGVAIASVEGCSFSSSESLSLQLLAECMDVLAMEYCIDFGGDWQMCMWGEVMLDLLVFELIMAEISYNEFMEDLEVASEGSIGLQLLAEYFDLLDIEYCINYEDHWSCSDLEEGEGMLNFLSYSLQMAEISYSELIDEIQIASSSQCIVSWSDLEGNSLGEGFEMSGLQTGTYTATLSHSNGCSYDQTIEVGNSCEGCIDAAACNYDEFAAVDDGSCLENDACGVCGGDNSTCGGCTDSTACNYNPNSTIDDGSCAMNNDECGVCNGQGAVYECGCSDIPEGDCDCEGNVLDACGVCGGDGIAEGECDCDANVLDECGICGGDDSSCTGCMDAGACNYDSSAVVDDGSCVICDELSDDCANPIQIECGDVVYGSNSESELSIFTACQGWGIDKATNFYTFVGTGVMVEISTCFPETNFDTRLYVFTGVCGSFSCVDSNNDYCDLSSKVVFQSIENDIYKIAINGQEGAQGVYGLSINCLGCTDFSACNYNPNSTIDDGSCAMNDECGVCNGQGAVYECGCSDIPEGDCDCEGNVLDCAGVCGGDSVEDECDICGGDGGPCADFQSCGDVILHDDYYYSTVQIGNQCWFADNCRYLPSVSPPSSGSELAVAPQFISPYYYVYGYWGTDVEEAKATANYATYGVLYNWNAVMTEGVCPSGWSIPWRNDFIGLSNFLGGEGVAGGKMKEAGYDHWNAPNTGATNSSGFTGLPGGLRWQYDNNLIGIETRGYFWTRTESGWSNAYYRYMNNSDNDLLEFNVIKAQGMSARCIKD